MMVELTQTLFAGEALALQDAVDLCTATVVSSKSHRAETPGLLLTARLIATASFFGRPDDFFVP